MHDPCERQWSVCGFVGAVGVSSLDSVAARSIRGLSPLLTHRGPDDEGQWTDAYAAFGFRRLSVLDLSASGHQPMVSTDGRWVLVFNGEVYNYRELRAELAAAGTRFRSDTDTEVVLNCLIHWGPEALVRFNGMFALGLYDREDHSLLLARDPMGIKPLYWYQCTKGIVFASQYDAVIRHPWCERQRLRPDVAALYLQYGYVPAPYGIVENTGQVPAGSLMKWTPDRGASVAEYAPWPAPPDRYLPPAEAEKAIHEAIRAAVRHQLVADVPVGTFLSGGIDSPLVTALSRSELGRPIPSFTIGSDNPAFDETDQARIYGAHLDVEHTVRTITEQDALSLYDDVLDAFTEPFGDYSAFPTMLVSRLAREQVTVALSGDGADELFFGYPRMWTVLRWRQFFALPLTVRRAIRKSLTHTPRWRPPETTTIGTLGMAWATTHTEFGGPTLTKVAPGLGSPPRDFGLYDLDGVPSADELAQWLRWNEVRGHLEKMLIKVDRASMHESLEVRVPLLDQAVVSAALSVDPFSCMDGMLGKLPLRRELNRHVPPALVSQPKRGFGVPLGDWLRGGLAERFNDRVLEHPVIFGDAFDRQFIRGIVDDHRRGTDRTQQMWNLLTLQEWADRHLRPLPA